MYSQFVARTPSTELADEWSPNRRALDKFLFLCDRMFEVIFVCATRRGKESDGEGHAVIRLFMDANLLPRVASSVSCSDPNLPKYISSFKMPYM